MPAGFACGEVCDAILIVVSIGACGGGGGGGGGGEGWVLGLMHFNLNLWLQAHGRIVLQYLYKCFRSLDKQLWDIIYCTCAEHYVESSWKFLLGI